MKNKNFLSNLWSLLVGSQRNDVEFDRRLTVGSPSGFTINWTLKLVSVLVLVLTIGVGNVWGAEEVIYTLTPATGGTNAYASLSEDIDCEDEDNEVTISWNAIGNTTLTPWRIGGKSLSNAVRVIYSETAISNNVTKVIVSHGAASSITANVTLNVYSTAAAAAAGGTTNRISSVSGGTVSANGKKTFTRPDGHDWSGRYYRFEYSCTVSGNTNRFLEFSQAEFYAEASSCEKIGAPTVTATPGDRQISLSWPNQAEASSYTVTCTGGTPGAVTGTTTKSCTITGLTNGTSYTWTVTPVGDGSTYCASGNTAASASATPNVYYTVTWMNNGSSYTTTSVASGQKPTFPNNPSSCDGTSTTFVGWTPTPWSGKLDDVSAKTIYTSGSAMPNVSGPVTYHAVFAKVTANTYKKGTKADLTNGQTVLIVNPSASVALKGDKFAQSVTITSNKITTASTAVLWTVEPHGSGYYFKYGSNYLNSYSGTLYVDEYTDEWSVSGSGPYVITSGNQSTKSLQYYSSTWKMYDTGNNSYFQMDFYIPDYSQYLTNCCTSLGSINGSVKSISGTGITLQWDDISNVSSWAVSGIDVTNSNTAVPSGNIGTPTDKGSTYECAISSLTAGHQYKFTISATASSGYCDKTQEITVSTPLITLSETGLSGMSYIEGFGPSTQTKTFTVTAVGLTGNLTVSSPTNFQVSTDNSSWGSSKTISHSSGSASGTVYVRLASGLSEGSYGSASTYVTVSGGSATTKNVSVQGSVSPACAAPTINTQPAASASYNMNVTATALTVVATKNGTGPALTYQWYSNTANSKTTPAPTLIDDATSNSYTPPTSALGTKYYFCEVSSGACAETTNISAITVNTPTITVSETARAFGDRKVSGGPYEMTFTVSGSNLAKDQGIGLAITGTNAGMFAIKNNVTSITQTSAGTVATTTVTVQYSPTGAGSHSATLTLSSTSATSKTVALTGTGKWEVTWSVNGGTTTSLVANSTKPTLPSPAPSSCDLTSTTFIGWATSSWSGKLDDVSDKTIHADNSTMSNITANGTTFYAVFAKAGGAPITWDKVASMNSLSVGDVFVFASGTNAVTDPENTTDPPKGTSITVNGSNQITSTVTDAMKWTFAKDGDNYTFYPNGDDEKWLRCNTTANSSSNNNMRVDAISGRTKFEIDNSGYLVTNDTYTDRYFSYYSDGNDFRGYTGTSNGAFVPICYKRNGGTTYSEYLTSCCDLKAVTGLTVSGVTGNSVTLTWSAPSPTKGIDHLELRNASTDAKIGSNIAVGTTTATVSDLTECTTYIYKVVSVGASCETPSEAVEGTPYSGAKTITYKYHDDVTADGSFTTDCTHSSTTLPNPSRTGYTLNGWFTAATGGTKKGDGGASYEPSADITLHAQWSLTNYTVTMAQTPAISATLTGGTTTAHYGNTINISTNVPSGYRFNGWTSSPSVTFANASATSTSFTMPASNVTVTANFVQVHSVSFSVPTGGGTVVSPPATIDHGGTLTFPNVTDVDCGTFLGWTTAANSSYSSTSTTPSPLYAAGATTTINDAATFYAVYSKVGDNPVSATLYAHSGDVNSITNAGYTNTTITATGIGTTNTTNYKTKFDDVGDKVIFQLDGTPTSFSAAFQTPSSGTSGTSTIKLYQSSSTSGPWAEITSVSISSTSTSATLSETTASNFTQRILKLEMTSRGYNMMCGDITIVGLRAPITYTTNPSCVDWRLQSIAVTTAPTKTTYNECEEFDPAGMVVTATMYEYGNESNTTTKAVAGYTCTPSPLTTPGNPVAVTISYTEKGVTKTATQNVTVTDLTNYTVTFHDGNTTDTWTQANHCDAVDLDDYTGALECGDYTFAGWSTSSTTYNDQAATITTWVSGEYTPTANTHLYAVYRKGEEPDDFTANCDGGTYYIYEANGNTHMSGRVNNTPRAYTSEYWNNDCLSCEGDDGTPFTFTKIANNTYKIQNSEGEYLRKYSTGNHPDFESTWHDEDNFKWMISTGTNGSWRFVNKAATDYALVKNGSYFDMQLASNVTALSSYYELELAPAASTVYQSNPNCGSTYTITFETHGGTFVQGDYAYATETTEDLSGTTSSYFPSATMAGCEFVGWKEGSAQEEVNSDAPTGLYEEGAALSVSSDKTYHAVYYYFDDDWEFDPVEGGTYHLYYEVSSTKYFVSSTPTDSWAYLSTSSGCANAKNVVVTPGTGVNAGKYSIAVDGYTIIPEDGGTKFKRGVFWWTITDRGDGTYAINGMNDNRNIVGNSYGNALEHTGYNAGGAYSGWYYPTFGRCRQNHWTSDPDLNPTITLGSTGALNITSTNGKTAWATNQLTVKATKYGTQKKLYLSCNVAGVGFLSSAGAALSSDANGTYIQTDVSGELTTTNIIVTYSPTVSTDGVENATITVRDLSSPSTLASATRSLKVRHLPTKFIIAEKVGDDWYALPNNMSNSQTNPAKVKISSVNEGTGVATIYSDVTDYLAWGMGMTTQASKKYTMEFYSDLVNDTKYLKTHTSSANTIGQYAKQTGTNQNYTEFKPTSSDLVSYTLYNEQWSYYLGISGDVWGVYSSSATLRFLGIDQHAAPTITWRNNMLSADHATNKAENGVVTLPTGADPVSCNTTLYPTFCGWKDGQIATYTTTEPTYVLAGDVATTDKTYYAVFKDATRDRWYTQCPTYYTLTFEAGTGTGDDYAAYTENSTYAMPDAATAGLSKEGYTLSGWTTTVDVTVGGNTITAGGVIGVGSTISGISGDMTFTAVWTGNISITGNVWLTSYNGVTVYTTSTTSNLITVSSADATGATRFKIIYLDGNGDEVAKGSSRFRLCNNGSSNYNMVDASSDYVNVSSGEYSQTYSISYTPIAHNTINTGTLKLQLMRGSTVLSEATLVLHGRALPEEFVVASKFSGEWYALPNTLESMEANAKAVAGVKITVDNTTTPTKVLYAPDMIVYQGAGRYEASNRYGIRLTDGTNHLQVSSTGSKNVMWLSSTGSSACQDWWLNSSDFGAYSVTLPSNTGNESKKIGMYGGNIGYYASPTSPSGQIYFLPIENKMVDNPAIVTEWGQNSLIVDVDAQSPITSVEANIDGGDAITPTSFGQTRTSVKSGATKYNYTITFDPSDLDFADGNKGKVLYLNWKNSGGTVVSTSAIVIPWIIAENGTMSTIDATKGHWDTEVHVLPNVTLTADGGSFGSSTVVVNHLEIYPGATVNVTTGTLTATNLVMRNGWTRAGRKNYDVARLYIASTANLTTTANKVFADWYIDFDQYYPIAVPWEVDLGGNDGSTLKYMNTKSNAIIGATTGSVRLRYYDGASRASNGQTNIGNSPNWKLYGADGSEAIPAKLQPGKGYAMTAKRPTGKAFSIIRMPLTIPSAAWTTEGEQGEVNGTHKDQVSVTAHGDEDTPAYAKGWNFIANPYMSLYGGTIEYSDETKVNFVNIPDVDFKEYEQVATATAKLKPASGFLIQAPKGGTLTFGTSKRSAAAPSYRNATKDVTKEQQAYILLADEQTEDMMGILVSEKYTADYELNADLEKLLSDGNTLRTYMRYNDMNMAYLAINEELAKQLIPVSVRIPADGEYTFKMHEASVADKLEGIYLTDYQTNTVTNLLYDSYTFNAVAGTDNVRFAINAVIGKREVPTGVDISDSNKDRPTKFIWNDKVYILHNNVIYDSTGKRVNVINK